MKKLIPDVSNSLTWLEQSPQILKGIRRGLEREALRVDMDGKLATTNHPEVLGSVLTHKWITTDFAEALLEFITPVDQDVNRMLIMMRDIHRYTMRALGDEYIWPFSMPCIEKEENIKLARYGTSNIGRLKTLYREGLKNRYGALMQIISGVHYNFSLPMTFWEAKFGKINKDIISTGYFRLIRNYYCFGWIIPYLFGASPAICSSFLQKQSNVLPFKQINCDHNTYYLPYATSLRLSDFGYSNRLECNLNITFNELHEYVEGLKRAIATPSKEYEKIGLEKEGKQLQINSNILQIEDELYALIRPKRVARNNETTLDALLRGGIEYVEVRSLDINPFSPIGIDDRQVRFLDLFMIWCALAEIPEMSANELLHTRTNWNYVILEGRKPGLMLSNDYNSKNERHPLQKIGKSIFRDLFRIAKVLDIVYGGEKYQRVCNELVKYFDYPELTFSAKILCSIVEKGISGIGCFLSEKYRKILKCEPLTILSESDFVAERDASLIRQREIEEADREPFSVFLSNRRDIK